MIDITSLYDISKKIVEIYKENLRKDNMLTTGALYNFTWNVEYNGEIFQLQLNLPKEWYFVEHGRKPSAKMPPVSAIENWIKVRRLVPRAKNGKVPSTRGFAFAIAKKIQKEGFYSPNHTGKHTLERSLKEAEPYIEELCSTITNILNREVNQDLVTIFDGLKTFDTK